MAWGCELALLRGEESGEHLGTFPLENTSDHFVHPMGKCAISNQVVLASRCPRFIVKSTKNEPRDSRLRDGPRAHHAGLECHHERVSAEIR